MFFFFNGPSSTQIYTLSLHDALPIFGRDLRELLAFLHHPLEVGGDDLEAHVARHDRADLLDQRPEGPLLLSDERWVGRDAVDDAEGDAFLELVDARRIEKDLHEALLSVTRSRESPPRVEPSPRGER